MTNQILARKLEVVADPPPDEIATAYSILAETFAIENPFYGTQVRMTAEGRERLRGLYLLSDIADPRCRFADEKVFRPMDAASIEVTPLTMTEFVASNGLVAAGKPRCKFTLWINEISLDAPPAAVAPWMAGRIVERSVRRRLYSALDMIQQVNTDGSLHDLLTTVIAELEAAREGLRRIGADAE